MCLLPSAGSREQQQQHPLNRHCKHALYPNDKEVLKLCYVIVEIKCEEGLELTYPVWQLDKDYHNFHWQHVCNVCSVGVAVCCMHWAVCTLTDGGGGGRPAVMTVETFTFIKL